MEKYSIELDDEHREYLDDLRDSGETNMFGAGIYLQQEFGLDRKEAREVLIQWANEQK